MNKFELIEKKTDVLSELQSLCDDENVIFSFYNDVKNHAYALRFEKNGKAIRFKVEYVDIESKSHSIVMKEIYEKLNLLFHENSVMIMGFGRGLDDKK